MPWPGTAGQGRRGGSGRGEVWRGEARQGLAGQACKGRAEQGLGRQGRQGVIRLGRARKAWHGRQLFSLGKDKAMTKFVPTSFKFADGFNDRGANPEKVYKELEKLKDNGDCSPESIVEKARSKRSAMHCIVFDKTDADAAYEYRLSRARAIPRALEVTTKEAPKQPMRAFNVVERKKPGSQQRTQYKTTAEILANPKDRGRLIDQALRQLIQWRNIYRQYNELAIVVEAIDTVEAELVDKIES